MPPCATIDTGRHVVRVEGDAKGFEISLTSRSLQDRLDLVTLTLTAPSPAVPPQLNLIVEQPIIDTHARWYPAGRSNRAMYPEWDSRFTSQMTKYAPVVCFYNLYGQNRLTLAASDAINPIEIPAGVFEETAGIKCQFRLFTMPHAAVKTYTFDLLIDTRDVAYHASLRHVSEWWVKHAGHAPLAVPEHARVPLYSTWYSFHQSLVVEDVVRQCRLARETGCEAVIVDDGWQTLDINRGYAFCGDWEPVRIGDMRGFVDQVHDVGMKFLLWYALPFVGKESRAIKRFEGKTLRYIEGPEAAVLDPRYPEVRDYLVEVFTTAMRDWDLDGFKLDFVDWFDACTAPSAGAGADCERVTEGATRVLTAIVDALRGIKPDALIEFRGPYTGPAMRRYANMFRSLDCPNDALSNRINTLDLRLLCGNTAIHSDMFMWHPDDSADSAALQLLSVLFSVPQVSVLIDRLSPEHYEMLRFWLGFWREHRDVLLDGEIAPLLPHVLYPVVVASTPHKRVVAVYEDTVVDPQPAVPDELLLVNATRNGRVVLEPKHDPGQRRMRVFDCRGQLVRDEPSKLQNGLQSIDIPPSGLARFTRG